MKQKLITFFVAITFLVLPVRTKAQGDFFFNCYGGSVNFWSANFMQLPTLLINSLIMDDEEGGTNYSLRYEFLTMKDGDSKIELDKGNYFGFKAKDMFSNFQYGLKFGWQPRLSPFGIYISCAYQYRQFRAYLDPETDDYSKFKLNYVRPGIGIRITPLLGLLENEGWSPILEVGTAYNYNFSCTAPYENAKEQFNNGITSTFALGVRFESWSISGGIELDNYDLLNQDYSPDNGISYPYKDIKTNHITAFLSISRDF